MTDSQETYQQLVDRVAWGIAQSFVHGTSLQTITHTAVQQAILWSVDNQKRMAEEAKRKRFPARKKASK